MRKTKPPYPAEFKEEAVRLARTSGKPVAQIARDLGVSFGFCCAYVGTSSEDAALWELEYDLIRRAG